MKKSLSQKIVEKINERLNITPSESLYDELVGLVAKELRDDQQGVQTGLSDKAHLGDPCVYCNTAHDEVLVGDCPAR